MAQLAEQSLPIPEVHSSKAAQVHYRYLISRNYKLPVRKDKNKDEYVNF